MTDINPNWFDRERMEAIRLVIDEIDKYRGEPIEAGKHPLHKAVVTLEGFVDDMKEWSNSRRQNLLLSPVRQVWFATLGASRSEGRNVVFVPVSEWEDYRNLRSPFFQVDRSGENPELAMKWAGEFRRLLESWLDEEPENWRKRLERIFRTGEWERYYYRPKPEPPAPELDWSKPIQLNSDPPYPAELIRENRKTCSPYSHIVLIDFGGVEETRYCRPDGECGDMQIENVPEPTPRRTVRWVNWYDNGLGGMEPGNLSWDKKEDAENAIYAIARTRVEGVEGQFDE